MTGRRAVFLDRDGVLVPDLGNEPGVGLPAPFPGVADALGRLRSAGWRIVVVTNQPAVGRGDLDEDVLRRAHEVLGEQLGGAVDAFCYCPHHPDADIAAYRLRCDCRKPRPGLLVQAAEDLDLELEASVMVGDRMTDIEAGHRAGCRTVLVTTGMHDRPRIVTPDAPMDVEPDHVAADAEAAIDWILTAP